MSPSPGDVSSSPEPRSTGGLASVFKGLAGSKLVKPPPPKSLSSSTTPVSAQLSSERIDTASLVANTLPPHHLESLEKLKDGTLNERIGAAASLRLAVADYPLNPVLQIWDAAQDLIESSKISAARIAGWELLMECAKNPSSTPLERKQYFLALSARANPDDFHLQLAAIVDLTNHGRDLSGFDYDVIPLLTTWLQDAWAAVKIARKHTARSAKEGKAKEKPVPIGALGEGKNFSSLFAFILEVLKFNAKVANDDTLGKLVDCLCEICMDTNNKSDLSSCIHVIDAIITYASLPKEKLAYSVEVLGSIHYLVFELQKTAWHTLANLLKSHNGNSTVHILLNVLRSHTEDKKTDKDAMRKIRGALSVLQKLIWKTSEKGYPAIPLALLTDGLANIVTKVKSLRVLAEILTLINSLLDGDDGDDGDDHKLNPLLEEEDWTALLDVAEKCARQMPHTGILDPDAPMDPETPEKPERSGKPKEPDSDVALKEAVKKHLKILENLLRTRHSDFIQRQECIALLTKLPRTIPDTIAHLLLDYFEEFRCCYPSDLEWEANLRLVVDCFFLSRGRSTLLRVRALRCITEVYDMLELVEDVLDEECVPNLVRDILKDICEETDILVLQETVSFVIAVGVAADMSLFDHVVDTLKGIIHSEQYQSPIAPLPTQIAEPLKTSDQSRHDPGQSPANVATRGYVQMFLKTMNTDGRKAAKTFGLLVYVARHGRSNDARLTAIKMLFRLRADWANRIYLTNFIESGDLAAVLHRTEAPLAQKPAEDAALLQRTRSEHGGAPRSSRGVSFNQSQGQERSVSSRSISGAKATNQQYQQLWSLSDPDALPESPSTSASPVLFSHFELEVEQQPGGPSSQEQSEAAVADLQPSVLDISSWVEAILYNLTHGCHWEIYSFILVHFPSQLSNHALFRQAVPQIQETRRVLCEQSRMNLFQDPPPATGLRRPEVNICILQALTMVMSYHKHFQKSDEDDLVMTFKEGIAHQTAKTCIHALAICCHELPAATSKVLTAILVKMSSVITAPGNAMHILEFLAALARLPSLYSHLKDDEARMVFGMCFRYLDTVRDKRRFFARSSLASEPSASGKASHEYDAPSQSTTSDDLPQYVYALAYHTIIFWFLALKLPDRPKQVKEITKRLFQDPDGGLSSDEQALITMDFMQRVAYSDADESAENPRFSDRRAEEYTEKRWIIANSIVSIKQSKTTPWAQVTKRQPSGTSYFTVRENIRPPPPHQVRTLESSADRSSLAMNNSIPSHLLIHFLSSFPQSYDQALRPLPLPDDDAVDRSIRMFDRIPTVDGHKVGVIYIGQNQTKEAEILANVTGSKDYVKFLNGLGTLTRLKGADFNTQGLDREYDTDGQYTFCWRDRVTEIMFHVTTQMPTNLDHDPSCINKKKHIGNDYVNVIFNNSGLPFDFDTFPSEFNYVNIVITPESRVSFVATRENAAKLGEDGRSKSFFKVQVLSKEGFPEISPAAQMKMVSLNALPDFVRLLALNASVFSLVWSHRDQGEYPSSWRSRLREIVRLRERNAPKAVAPSPPSSAFPSGFYVLSGPPAGPQSQPAQSDSRPSSSVRDSAMSGLSLRRASVATFLTNTSEQTQSHRSSIISAAGTADTEIMQHNVDNLVDSLDFSKWA